MNTSLEKNALELAHLLLATEQVNFCAAIGVDVLVEQLQLTMQSLTPPAAKVSQGAGAVLLANETGMSLLRDSVHSGEFLGVAYDFASRRAFEGEFYDSNGVELLARSELGSTLDLVKPDGTASKILFTP